MTVLSGFSLVEDAVPDRINDIEDVKRWIAAKDATDREKWKSVGESNKLIAAFGIRLASLERRVMWICGAAAALGGVIGAMGKDVISG